MTSQAIKGKKGFLPDPRPLIDRFWDSVHKTDGCWEWKGQLQYKFIPSLQYGIFNIGDRHYRAHRWIYEYLYGPVPKGMFVCHRCDNPSCVRPEHLFLGTNSDNQKDCAQKGRNWHQKNHTVGHPVIYVKGEKVGTIIY